MTAEEREPEGPQELFVENRMTPDGAEHLLKVGRFATFEEIARAAYVHMNGPIEDRDAELADAFAESARAIRKVITPENAIFLGLSESGETFRFLLEPAD